MDDLTDFTKVSEEMGVEHLAAQAAIEALNVGIPVTSFAAIRAASVSFLRGSSRVSKSLSSEVSKRASSDPTAVWQMRIEAAMKAEWKFFTNMGQGNMDVIYNPDIISFLQSSGEPYTFVKD